MKKITAKIKGSGSAPYFFASQSQQALFLAFFLFIFWTYFNFSSPLKLASAKPIAFTTMAYEVSLLANTVTLLICAIRHRSVERKLFSSLPTIGSAFLCTIGTALVYLTPPTASAEPLSTIVGSALTGIGSAMILLMLGAIFTQHHKQAGTVFAALLSAYIAASLFSFLPQPILLTIILSIPPLIVVLLSGAMADVSVEANSDLSKDDIKGTASLLLRFAIMVLAFYSTNTLAKKLYQGTGAESDPMALVSISVLIAAFLVMSCLPQRKFNPTSLYRAVLLFTLASFLSIPMLNEDYAFSYGALSVSIIVFRSLLLICECQICFKTGLSPVLVFGLGEALKRVPNLTVIALQTAAIPLPFALEGSEGYLFWLLAFVVFLVFVYVMVFTENDMRLLTEFDRTLSAQEQLERRLGEIAEKHGLTEREAEVFSLFAQGRSVPYIASTLYLSQGTVNVHAKKIYKKLDIHSRQELIDLANEGIDRKDAQRR